MKRFNLIGLVQRVFLGGVVCWGASAALPEFSCERVREETGTKRSVSFKLEGDDWVWRFQDIAKHSELFAKRRNSVPNVFGAVKLDDLYALEARFPVKELSRQGFLSKDHPMLFGVYPVYEGFDAKLTHIASGQVTEFLFQMFAASTTFHDLATLNPKGEEEALQLYQFTFSLMISKVSEPEAAAPGTPAPAVPPKVVPRPAAVFLQAMEGFEASECKH